MSANAGGVGRETFEGAPVEQRSARVPSVYLLDDHEVVRRVVAAMLEATGDFRVLGQGGSLSDGMRDLLIERLQVDVAIVDVGLGDGDGIELCRRIKSDRGGIAVVILTAHADDPTFVRAREAGADAVVEKQVRGNTLLVALREAVQVPS